MTDRTDNSAPTSAAMSDVETVIRPWPRLRPVNLKELWQARELLFAMSVRGFHIRYKQSLLGVSWAILQPVVTIVVFGTVLYLLKAKPNPSKIPYPLTAFCAMLPWQFFAKSVTQGTTSIVRNQGLIKKIYFPRLILPLEPMLTALADFAIALVVLLIMMACYGRWPTLGMVFVPLFLLLATGLAMGIALWTSALNALWRDLGIAIPFLVQMAFFCSPVVYETKIIGDPTHRMIYSLNPMVGVLDGFRWALLGADAPDATMLWISVGTIAVVLVSGAFFFRYVERIFVDRV